jgi:hypothetical protein
MANPLACRIALRPSEIREPSTRSNERWWHLLEHLLLLLDLLARLGIDDLLLQGFFDALDFEQVRIEPSRGKNEAHR